jgi:hypothetical protein
MQPSLENSKNQGNLPIVLNMLFGLNLCANN